MSAPAKLESPSARLRALCLALPEATEVVIKRGPTFRVEDKIFALDRLVEGRPSVWFKAPAGASRVDRRRSQPLLLAALLWREGLGRNVARPGT